MPVSVEVTLAAQGERAILEDLLSSYAREFSKWHTVRFNPDGTFTYPALADYWLEPDHFPFLLRVERAAVAGFTLVRRVDSALARRTVWDVAEFFVGPAFRRQRLGTMAACQIWGRFPGLWQVRVLEANRPALRFWESTVHEFTGVLSEPVPFKAGGESWRGFLFESV